MVKKKILQKIMSCEPGNYIPYDGMVPTKSPFLYLPLLPPKSWQPDVEGLYPNVESIILKAHLWKWHPNPETWNPLPPKKWWTISPRKAVDPFGCIWEYSLDDVSKGHPGAAEPMKDLDEDTIKNWNFPDPYDKSMYKLAKIGKYLPWKYKIGALDSLIYARVQYLRGFSQSLSDLARNNSGMTLLIRKITDYFLGVIDMFAKYGKVDAVLGQDDMGAQNECFMSPRMYKKHIAPAYQELADRAHKHGMKFILHSCGHVNQLMPIWVEECGIDGFQFDSPHMTGLDFLEQYAGKVCLLLVPDIQEVYPFATPEEFELEVKTMIEKLGKKGGLIIRDYFSAHKVLHAPKENVKALPKLVKKYGKL